MKNKQGIKTKVETVVTKKRQVDIPQEKINEYKESFDMFDKDQSGKISVDEIYKVLKNMGNEIPKTDIKKMIADMEPEDPNEINFEEFISFMQNTIQTVMSEEDEVIKAFQTFDKDNSGTLTNAEFRHILTNLGQKFTDEEVNEIFKEADLNQDGILDYQEFVNFWRSK